MSSGELLTRGTIWITLLAYAIGSATFALAQKRVWADGITRIAWTIACISLVAHLICGYQFFYGWSQQTAYADTARQTQEVVGLAWGGGLFINYALLIAWTIDLGVWWRDDLESYRKRPWPLLAAWHGFLIFIIFNATVVFKHGLVRWVGLAICVGLSFTWVLVAKERATTGRCSSPTVNEGSDG